MRSWQAHLATAVALAGVQMAGATDPPWWERVGTTRFVSNQIYDIW